MEVYQESIYTGVSAKKAFCGLQAQNKPKFYNNVQLSLLHTTSKRLNSEYKNRDEYMKLVELNPFAKSGLLKLAFISSVVLLKANHWFH